MARICTWVGFKALEHGFPVVFWDARRLAWVDARAIFHIGGHGGCWRVAYNEIAMPQPLQGFCLFYHFYCSISLCGRSALLEIS